MVESVSQGIYRIGVTLPHNPLKELNSYVIVTDDRNLLIDTGFNQKACLAALQEGIAELGLDMEKTDVFLTHLHADHTGLVDRIITPKSTVYMSRVDKEIMDSYITSDAPWRIIDKHYLAEGFPKDELTEVRKYNPAQLFTAGAMVDYTPVAHGDVLQVGDIRLECISTPGHTPGHMCLYIREEGILFSGDHILFDITPNITMWMETQDSLQSYMDSLKAIKGLPVKLCLPGHRANNTDLDARIDTLLRHHQDRLAEVRQILTGTPNVTSYEVASRMKWSIRAKDWSDFPLGQKWFAVGEALAHINHLVQTGVVDRSLDGDIYRYRMI